MVWNRIDQKRSGSDYIWQLERPKPALPDSYFWTWDHSTNWVLDDPGMQTRGCLNPYLKGKDTYLEDYRRLTDLAAGLGIRGIIIWGFLRDSHGGVEYARRVASYAASKGVAIIPGVGTTWYGGAYYEGDHEFSLRTFLDKHPEARMIRQDGKPFCHVGDYGACPVHPAYQTWLKESLNWLFGEFEIGGINLENGDLMVDYHPLTRAARKDWPEDDPEPFFFQGLSYKQALESLRGELDDKLITYATYTGFNHGHGTGSVRGQGASTGEQPPAMLKVLPENAICQWTLTGMLLDKSLPLLAYLDDGAPAEAFDNPNWPADLRPLSRRSIGFVHQGSQWNSVGRYELIVGYIKEACLRAYRAGFEGVGIHGEVSKRHIPWALNYLAFSHFIHWPEDTMRGFGRKTLGRIFGNEEDGETFAEALCYADAGKVSDDVKKRVEDIRHLLSVADKHTERDEEAVIALQRYHFWQWLLARINGEIITGDSAPFAM